MDIDLELTSQTEQLIESTTQLLELDLSDEQRARAEEIVSNADALLELIGGAPEAAVAGPIDAEPAPSSYDRNDRSAQLAGHRVLIVDEDDLHRRAVKQILETYGMECVRASDGASALDALYEARRSGRPFDLALLSHYMEEMDGLVLARSIKLDPELAAIPLVLMSPEAERMEAEIERYAIAAVVANPVEPSDTIACLTSVLFGPPLTLEELMVDEQPTFLGIVERAVRPAHVLVVDDNAANVRAMLGMLHSLGQHARSVASGAEAVRALESELFDLVLMDFDLPEMSGIEAAREIRRVEGTSRHTPIVAMASNALEGDREQGVSAGMDDCIAKPVGEEKLQELLHRFGPNRLEVAAVSSVGPIDTEKLADLEDLSLPGEDLVVDSIDLFLRDTPGLLEALHSAVEHASGPAIALSAHALRDHANNMGATELVSLCAELEQSARQADSAGASILLADIDAAYKQTKMAMLAELERRLA